MPILPIYFYTNVSLQRESIRDTFNQNLLDQFDLSKVVEGDVRRKKTTPEQHGRRRAPTGCPLPASDRRSPARGASDMTAFIVRRVIWTIPVHPARHLPHVRPHAADRGEPVSDAPSARSRNRSSETSRRSTASTVRGTCSTRRYVEGVFTFDLGPSLVLRNRDVNGIVQGASAAVARARGARHAVRARLRNPARHGVGAQGELGLRLRGDVRLERRVRDTRASSSRPCSSTSSLSSGVTSSVCRRAAGTAGSRRSCRRSRSVSRRWRTSRA